MIPIRRRLYQSNPGFTPRQLFAALQGAWYEPSVDTTYQESTGITPGALGSTVGKMLDRSGYGYNATQATAANEPLLTTDSAGKVLLRHDATDVLTASLPSINVRRNLLTWSEQFDNGGWTKDGSTVLANTALSFDGTNSADKFTESSGGANHRLTVAYPTTSASYTYSIYAKKAERNWLIIQLADSSGADRRAWFNIDSGVVGTVNTNLTASIQSKGNGWYRCIITIATARNGGNYPYIWLSTGDGVLTYSGDGVSGLYIDKAQLELGSVATDYQRVTDWTSEAYSSNGSVYFATPVGMSALHNQSMGTTYQLPALSTDIYSWIVVPQRLSTAQETRLGRYMLRKAGLALPDYLTDDAGEILTDDIGDPLLAG